jgi:hypothetical protein
MFHPVPIQCRCSTYARASLLDGPDGHHRNCELHPENTFALIARLVDGIDRWAAEEDGVPDRLWDAYQQARYVVNLPALSEEKP